ncbi:S8 family serine peptidase [candidate division WOR-3 bacterium]|nr:S8 family serine peptidase [candidate division WOR-3 bacterium]
MSRCFLFLFVGLFYMTSVYGQVPEEEILILTTRDVITMPYGASSATPGEIEAPSELISLLLDVGATQITIAMPEFDPIDTMRITPDGNIARLPDFSQLFIIGLPSAANRDSLIALLEILPQIIRAEKNQRAVPRDITIDDPYFGRQWNLHNTGQYGGTSGADISALEAWSYSTGNNSVILGIVDGNGNVDWNHEEFAGRIFGDLNGTPSDHATHVAGIAAALTNNYNQQNQPVGIAGIDWHASINIQNTMAGQTAYLIQGIIDAANAGAKAINCSWGLPSFSQNLYDAFVYAYQMGALPVCAMAYPFDPIITYPDGNGPWVLTVNASNNRDEIATYADERYYVDIAAWRASRRCSTG